MPARAARRRNWPERLEGFRDRHADVALRERLAGSREDRDCCRPSRLCAVHATLVGDKDRVADAVGFRQARQQVVRIGELWNRAG